MSTHTIISKQPLHRYILGRALKIASLFLFSIHAEAQIQTKEEKYVVLDDTTISRLLQLRGTSPRSTDFHIHTGMKNSNNHIPSPSWLRQHMNDANLRTLNWSGRPDTVNNKFNNFTSYRQADWGMVAQSNASILVSSISPLEKHLLSKIRPLKFLPISIRFINRKVSGLTKSRIKTIYSKDNSCFDEFNSELKFLSIQDNTSPDFPGRRISFATNKNDLIKKYSNGETALVLSLEGGHIFHGNTIAKNQSYDHKVFDSIEVDEILRNVDSVKNLPNRVFFAALGHFSWNGLVGYSKTLDMDNNVRKWLRKFSKSRSFRTKLFLSFGQGILGKVQDEGTDKDVRFNDSMYCRCQKPTSSLNTWNVGWRVIEKLLDTTGIHHAPIFVDVKHMDVRARLDYYNYLKAKQLTIPIIASHVAVSGKDTSLALYTSQCPVFDVYEEVEDPESWYYGLQFRSVADGRKACLDCSKANVEQLKWFYPWGINLATEEIPIIYESDGIIGLALEERVIGTDRPNYDVPYFSAVDKFLDLNDTDKVVDRQIFHAMLPFFKNLFFIAEHSGRPNVSAWDHISLGSDFDGIAKPVSFCKTIADVPKFHQLLIKYLPWFVKLENKDPYTVLHGLTSEQIANKVVYENGERFILKYF